MTNGGVAALRPFDFKVVIYQPPAGYISFPSPGGLRLVEPTPWRGGTKGGGLNRQYSLIIHLSLDICHFKIIIH